MARLRNPGGKVGRYLYGVVWSLLPVQAADGGLDDPGLLLDLKDGRPSVLVNHVLLCWAPYRARSLSTLGYRYLFLFQEVGK